MTTERRAVGGRPDPRPLRALFGAATAIAIAGLTVGIGPQQPASSEATTSKSATVVTGPPTGTTYIVLTSPEQNVRNTVVQPRRVVRTRQSGG